MNSMAGDRVSEKHFYDLLRKREKAAMEFLYDHYAAVMYGIIAHVIHNEDKSEQVLAKTFQYIWKNYKEFDPDKMNISLWVINITRRICKEEISFQNFTRNNNQPAVFTSLDKSRLSISGSPAAVKNKKVFDLLFFGNGSVAEVAKHSGMTKEEIKRSVREAISRLRFSVV